MPGEAIHCARPHRTASCRVRHLLAWWGIIYLHHLLLDPSPQGLARHLPLRTAAAATPNLDAVEQARACINLLRPSMMVI